jgi:hypothetical protein
MDVHYLHSVLDSLEAIRVNFHFIKNLRQEKGTTVADLFNAMRYQAGINERPERRGKANPAWPPGEPVTPPTKPDEQP